MDQSQFIDTCNAWAKAGTPFLFIIDYELEQFFIFRPGEAAAHHIFYNIRGKTNVPGVSAELFPGFRAAASRRDQPDADRFGQATSSQEEIPDADRFGQATSSQEEMPDSSPEDQIKHLKKDQSAVPPELKDKVATEFRSAALSGFRFEAVPMAFPRYEKAFSLVKRHIMYGNSFLLNLTFPTPVLTDLSLSQIFHGSQAPYRLLFGDRFVVFSPETFVTIRGNSIRSYPMKGTIDAALPGAEQQLLGNEKELWEHNTIVDLIRNDLSMVASDVRVSRFRYIDCVQTHRGGLLQVSSEIGGHLGDEWQSGLGMMLLRMLPAGSICGAPKRKTVEIIAAAEGEKRGFFTGIFGIFDGEGVDSAVMIRYIERVNGRVVGGQVEGERTMWDSANGGLQFRSGGGITGHSVARSEYNEMIEKVYVPIVGL